MPISIDDFLDYHFGYRIQGSFRDATSELTASPKLYLSLILISVTVCTYSRFTKAVKLLRQATKIRMILSQTIRQTAQTILRIRGLRLPVSVLLHPERPRTQWMRFQRWALAAHRQPWITYTKIGRRITCRQTCTHLLQVIITIHLIIISCTVTIMERLLLTEKIPPLRKTIFSLYRGGHYNENCSWGCYIHLSLSFW